MHRCNVNYDSEGKYNNLEPNNERLSLIESPKNVTDSERKCKCILRVPKIIGNQMKNNNYFSFAKEKIQTQGYYKRDKRF